MLLIMKPVFVQAKLRVIKSCAPGRCTDPHRRARINLIPHSNPTHSPPQLRIMVRVHDGETGRAENCGPAATRYRSLSLTGLKADLAWQTQASLSAFWFYCTQPAQGLFSPLMAILNHCLFLISACKTATQSKGRAVNTGPHKVTVV